MSNILRYTLKYSVKQFGYCLNLSNGVFINRSTACINQFLKNSFHTSITNSSHASIDQQIKKLDSDARRNGRISLREVEDVIEGIKSSRSASSSQSLMVIGWCGNLISEEIPEKRTQLVQEVWQTLEKLEIALSINHYNALLRVYLENEHLFDPAELLAELEQKGIEPDRVTYQRLITRYCHTGDIKGATHILQVMREKKMPINEIVFNALVLGNSKANDMKSAEEILNVMKQARIEPTAETYTILICGYINEGNLNKVMSILEACKQKDIVFIDKYYLEMIYHMALKNLEVDEILSKVKRNTGYNFEAINYVYKLVNAGRLEIAYKIVKSMVRSSRLDGSLTSTGGFFIAALVRNDVPVTVILKYCDRMVEENLNMQALNAAMEASLRLNKESLTFDLFRAAKERSVPLRIHYFWPLIVSRGNRNDTDGIFKVLSSMHSEFNVPINMETIREYVAPVMLKNEINIATLLTELKSCGVSTAASVSALVTHLLLRGRIRDAAEIASSYRTTYSVFLIRKPLVRNYLRTSDADSFTTILKQVADGIQFRATGLQQESILKDDEEVELPDYRDSVGNIVLDVVKQLKTKDTCETEIEKILKLLYEKGIGISSRSAEAIQTQLQDKLAQKITTLLEKLTGDDLPAVERMTGGGIKFTPQSLNEDSLVRLYNTMKSEGEVSKPTLKQLFNMYGRSHNLEKLLELKGELEKKNFVLSNGMYAHIIDSYVENEKFDDAWNIYQSLVEKNPDFVLNPTKTLRLASLAVKNEQYDKFDEILSRKTSLIELNQTPENSRFDTDVLCLQILNHFAQKSDVENVKKYFNLITNNKYCSINNILLEPLIQAYLVKNDLEGALKEFENCCIKYRLTPLKTELVKRCIESENASSLQHLFDLSTEIHGETNSLYDLMFSFLECGRLRLAKRILEYPGLPVRQDRLQNACQKYQNNGSTENLENLLALTKNISSIDRSDLYYNLLLAYDKTDEPQKAMKLWLQMQEEDETPTESFLILLGDILQKNKFPVPFVVPEATKVPFRVQQVVSKEEMSRDSIDLRELLSSELDKAVNFKNSQKSNESNNADLSLLLEAMTIDGKYEEAKNIYLELVSQSVLPKPRILKYFAINAMSKGDVELLENLRSRLDYRLQTYLKIDDQIGKAYLQAGRADEYLNKLEKELDSINSKAEMDLFMKSFSKKTMLLLLEQNPQFSSQVKRIAVKCLERDSNNLTSINILWLHHIDKRNYDEAENLWVDYLQNSQQPVVFKGFCDRAVRENNSEMLQVLKGFLERKTNESPRSTGIVYSSLIETLVAQDKLVDAVKILEEGVSKIGIENVTIDALEILKDACEAKNIPFNFEIPENICAEDMPNLQRNRIILHEKKATYDSNSAYLQILGSGSKGGSKSVYFSTDFCRYMFNCGEGTQRLANEHKINVAPLKHIFITHSRWSNIGGLPSLALTVQEVGVPDLTFHGPEGIESLFATTHRFVILYNLNIKMAECARNSIYEDPAVTVHYVPLLSNEVISNTKSDEELKIPEAIESQDDIDYYAYTKERNQSQKSPQKLSASPGISKFTSLAMSYICKLKPKLGTLNLKLCAERGVPPGPLLDKLNIGENIVLPGGTVVKSAEVEDPDCLGPVFIVLDCPSVDYLDSLLNEEKFKEHQIGASEENLPKYVIHFTPSNVMENERYQTWMKRFPESTLHVNVNDSNTCLGNVGAHILQYQLNYLDPEIFPLLDDKSIPIVDVPLRKKLSLESKDTSKQSEPLNLSKVQSSSEFAEKLDIPPEIGHTLKLLDLRNATKSEFQLPQCVYMNPQSVIEDLHAIEGFQSDYDNLKSKLSEISDEVKSENEKHPYPIITFLGTGSSIPKESRNTSGILITLSENNHMILDCGEGTYGQFVRSFGVDETDRILASTKAIYISHLHADHHIGLISLLLQRREAVNKFNSECKKVYLLAPYPIVHWLYRYHFNFEPILDCIELIGNHELLSVKYENPKLKTMLDVINVKEIRTCEVAHCPHAFGISITDSIGKKITYSGDTMPCNELVEIGKDSDLLIHEATFENDLYHESKSKKHSTTGDAIKVGKQMNAKFTMLTHFSQRYDKIPVINEDFDEKVGVAFDNMRVRLGDLKKLPLFNSILKTMFAEEQELRLSRAVKRKSKFKMS